MSEDNKEQEVEMRCAKFQSIPTPIRVFGYICISVMVIAVIALLIIDK
ncbi:hypothetical protein [Paenibacillus albiflavus]|nr:hypothetical protein [Paenibacillus albiflavus]